MYDGEWKDDKKNGNLKFFNKNKGKTLNEKWNMDQIVN
jgi:hypothetical protein